MDRPVLELNTQSSGGNNTVGDVATLDIGESSDLVIDVLSFSKNRLHFDNFLIRHPFNSA